MIENVDTLLDKKNIDIIAEYIVDRLQASEEKTRDKEKEFANVDFHLSKGKMNSSSKNTQFFFDVDSGILYDIIHAFYIDDKDKLPKDDDEEKLNELARDFDRLEEFLSDIKESLETKFKDGFIKAIRKNLMSGVEETLIPMQDLHIVELFLSNPIYPYTLKVLKGRTIKEMEEKSVVSKSIAKDLLDKHLKTGKEFEQIIAEEKVMGNEDYRYVFGVEKIKSEYNCHLYAWVNYGLVEKDVVKI